MALAEHRSPTAAELDVVCLQRPLHVISRTFHESAVNSAGLEALGIDRGTPDPPGGRIVRNRRGSPTGVLLRRDRRGRLVRPDEAISVAEALDAATRSAAEALGAEKAGTLEPGREADLLWLDRDPLAVAPEELASTVTLSTWRLGRLVHRNAAAPATTGG